MGAAVAEVRDATGESVRCAQANAARLRAYIADLKPQTAAGHPVARDPFNPIFGGR